MSPVAHVPVTREVQLLPLGRLTDTRRDPEWHRLILCWPLGDLTPGDGSHLHSSLDEAGEFLRPERMRVLSMSSGSGVVAATVTGGMLTVAGDYLWMELP